MAKNLWFLTEERPKKEVLVQIFERFAKDYKYAVFIDGIRILPILQNDEFTFTYEVIGFKCKNVDKVFIKTISGKSSFTDYLIFYQVNEPDQDDIPIYAIEETKTDDSESRNTGVYQRCSKFIFIDTYYPEVKKIMLYNLKVEQKETPTDTNIFGTRMLLTIGVDIMGKTLEKSVFKPFTNVDEVIALKNEMRQPPKGNIPIKITKFDDRIEISGRLIKANRLSHDPNIGALSIIAGVLRELGWTKKIVITEHGLISQKQVGSTNKFIQIANKLNVSLKGLEVPEVTSNSIYWDYDKTGEKLGTIFIHIVIENFTTGYSIFENHAGCEKGYFITKEGKHIPLAKYKDRVKYKSGDKSEIISIPDLILIDFERKEAVNIEGKTFENRFEGIKTLSTYNYIEKNYILKYYPNFKIVRTVVLYGSKEEELIEIKLGFLLNENGKLILGVEAPRLFIDAINNLLSFWG